MEDWMLPSSDVVVIGGGVVGTAITYYLAKAGVNVCLVEKADFASGTSSACGNVAALQTKPPGPKLSLALRSMILLNDLEKELDADLEFSNEGGMFIAETEEEVAYLSGKAEKIKNLGVNVEFVDGDTARALESSLAKHILGATVCPQDSTLNPMKLALSFARSAKRLGAVTRTFCEVIGIDREGIKIKAVVTKDGKIPTNTIVNAAGVWSPVLAKMVGLDLPVKPRKGELFVTEKTPPLWRGVLGTARYLLSKSLPEAENGNDELRTGVIASMTASGNLLIGATREFVGFDLRSTYRGVEGLLRHIAKVIPATRNLHMLRTYSGLRPSSPDGLPIIGRSPELPSFIIASGHEGDGIILSPITGKLIADLVVGDVDESLLGAFAWSRFLNQSQSPN
jgi:glycine/D-amino acid oxidase-like deaminating enzyme